VFNTEGLGMYYLRYQPFFNTFCHVFNTEGLGIYYLRYQPFFNTVCHVFNTEIWVYIT
jgi:hypothetical protein